MPLTPLLGRRRGEPDATPYATMEINDNIFERVGMSLYNALKMDPEASVRALVAPASLPPKKRRKLSQDFIDGREGMERFILNEVTNPLILVGAALSFRWPVLDPSKYTNAASTLRQYERYIPGPLRKLLGMNEVFAGTPITRLAGRISVETDNFVHRHFDQIGQGIMSWRKSMGRKETVVDEIRWAIRADGTFSKANVRHINRRIRRLNDKRGQSNQLASIRQSDIRLDDVPADELVLKPYQQSMRGVRSELSKDRNALARMTKFGDQTHGITADVKWIGEDYFPRLATKNYKTIAKTRERFIASLIEDADATGSTALDKIRRFAQTTARAKTARLSHRKNLLVPEPVDLGLLPQGTISERVLHSIGEVADAGMISGRPAAYSLRFAPTVGSYAYSTGRSYAWAFLPHGGELLKEAGKVARAERRIGLGLSKTELLRNTFIPQIMGTVNFDQAMKATEWAGVRQAAWSMVNNKKSMAGVPGFAKDGLRKLLEEDTLWQPGGAGHKIANYFYASTLGFNLSSASQNLLQPLITTGPLIGMANTARGMATVFGRIPKYLRLRATGKSEREALELLFPDFVASGGELGALTTEVALRESADIAKGGVLGLKTTTGKMRDLLLAPFRQTELLNRLTAFEGGLYQGKAFGLHGANLQAHATDVVNLTQMWAGGASTPSFMTNWWGPLKQLITFPAKVGAFGLGSITPTLTSAGVELGIGAGFNPGVLGRALVTSATAYEAAKEFGDADISRSLFFGGLPLPQEQAVLSPLPVLPPAVSLVAGITQDLVTGKLENIPRSVPLLIPAGVQLAKLSQTYAPEIAKALGRGYADTTKTLPDGRVPMYDSKGQHVGYKSSFELFLSNIGIPGKLLTPNGDADVRKIERYFLGQRDRIREMRQLFMNSVLDGEYVDAEKVQTEYLKDYGTAIEVRPQDWDAVSMRRFIPRLERIVKTIPVDVRGRFLQIAHTALAGSGERFLGVDPLLLSLPRKTLRQILQRPEERQGDPFQ